MPKTANTPDIETVSSVLDRVFAATYALYFRTHSYHWNIVGADFHSTHAMLEEQYTALWRALDEIAERYRAMGLPAPHAAPAVSAMAPATSRDAMLADLLAHHEVAIAGLRDGIEELDGARDIAGADFLTELLAGHEKTAWMLRASLSSRA